MLLENVIPFFDTSKFVGAFTVVLAARFAPVSTYVCRAELRFVVVVPKVSVLGFAVSVGTIGKLSVPETATLVEATPETFVIFPDFTPATKLVGEKRTETV